MSLRIAGGLLSVGLFVGCGGSPQPPTQNTADSSVADSPDVSRPSAGEPESAGRDSRTKWLGDVPYDVFYDQPLAEAGGAVDFGATVSTVSTAATPSAASANAVNPAASPAAGAATATPPAAAGDDVAWSQLIAPEVLDEESKVIRTRLTSNLQRVATYNRSVAAIETDAIVLAALAGIAERLDAPMRWKDRAAAVRVLAAEVSENASGSGRSAFEEARRPFERLLVILDGGPTDEVETSEAAFGDYAYQASMMQRVDQSFKWLRSTVVSGDTLSREKDAAVREASLLAAVGQMIKDDSYGFESEPSYQGYADAFVAACRSARDAASADDFEAFREALTQIESQCNACHSEYAFGTDGL